MKRIFSGLLTAVLLVSLTACSDQTAEKTFLAMDTAIRLSASGGKAQRAMEQGEQQLIELERMLSRTLEESDVSRINAFAGEWADVDPVTGKLVQAAASYAEETGGAFDVTIAPVVAAWGFTTDIRQVPSEHELQTLLNSVDGTALQMEQNEADKSIFRVVCGKDQQIDLGGIAKGYASDRMADIFAVNEVESGLAALGGNVLAYGTKADGSAWKVGVQDPKHPEDGSALVGIVELESAFAVTSGGYQRFFEEAGKTYHHIIDPATGYPADSGLTSVTVVAPCALDRTGYEPGNGTNLESRG